MKIAILVILSGGLCAAGAFVWTAREHAANLARERAQQAAERAQWEAERAKLQADLEAVLGRPLVIAESTPAAPAPAFQFHPPQETLEKLRQFRLVPGSNRAPVRRQILHQLANLADAGPVAVPVIRAYLAEMQDVDYTGEFAAGAGGQGRGGPPPRGRGRASLDFEFPPSLRLGLVDVLREIGGNEAEDTLAEMLATTGRAVEVAYAAKALQEMAPDRHREAAIAAAIELLTNPPAIDQPNRLDEGARDYLYRVLTMFGDTSFASTAQTMLISGEGRVDRQVLNYLSSTLKDQAMPAIYQAYQDARITNQMEKAALIGAAFNYIGASAQANQMFSDVLSATNVPTPLKAMAVAGLAGLDRGGLNVEKPTEPITIDARVQLLESMRPGLADERLVRVVDRTVENLNNLKSGQPVKDLNLDFRELMRGGQGGQPGNRGRRGG
jgi:hypothetical protein